MSNYTEPVYCPKCKKKTPHDFLDMRGVIYERSASGCYYRVICTVCSNDRREDELEVKENQ